jgi:hypothetical protein
VPEVSKDVPEVSKDVPEASKTANSVPPIVVTRKPKFKISKKKLTK